MTAASATAKALPTRSACALTRREQDRHRRERDPQLVGENVQEEDHLAVPHKEGKDVGHGYAPTTRFTA